MSVKSKNIHAVGIIISIIAIIASAADWPNFHGPSRANKSAETGLLKSWPEGGPRLLWTVSNIGNGFSGAAVAGGVVYTAGVRDNTNFVFAINKANGKILWETQAGGSWEAQRAFARAYAGSRSTPTVSGGMVYYLSDVGLLVALDAKTGAQKWQLNIRETYDAEMPEYGYSESPLIDGDMVFASPYGKKAGIVALNKNTGKPVWETHGIAGTAGYASPVLVETAGFRQIVSLTGSLIYGADVKTGKVLWTAPFQNHPHKLNCNGIIFSDGHIFASTGYGKGSILVKLISAKNGVNAEVVYEVTHSDNQHGGLVLHEGYVYGSGQNTPGWFSIDFKTGQQAWTQAPGKGSITFADGMLYLFDEREGVMRLIKATPEKFEETGTFKVPDGTVRSYYWAHPVISHGVLYVRYADNLHAYSVK